MNQETKAIILEALQIGRDAAYEAAVEYHERMKGYRRVDKDVELIDKAIELMSTQSTNDTKKGISYYDVLVPRLWGE